MDKLEHLFQLQDSFNKRLNIDTQNLSEEGKAQWALNFVRAMQQELAELVDSVPWKWWARYQSFDEQNARVEVVDLFHFLIALAQVFGMSAEDVYEAYLKKNKINHDRQDAGYAVKDTEDCKHV